MPADPPSRLGGFAPDVAIAVLVAAVGAVGHALAAGPRASALGVGLVGAAGLSLAARRRWPIAVLVATGAAAALAYLTGEPHQGPFIILPVLVALYTTAATGHRRAAISGAVAVTLALIAGLLRPDIDPIGVVWGIGWVAAAVVAGEVILGRRAYLLEVEARAVEAERTREEEARRRAGEERLRIARELHDVVAHNLSMINVQAGVAAHLLDSQPERARPALLTIKQASRDALQELRATLGILREGDESGEVAPRAPVPGLARLDGLVEGTRDAGLPVEVRVEGPPRPLSGPVDLAGYRIVQESLTNALRHAGPARAEVTITYGQHDLRIRVDDDGRGPTTPSDTVAGHGITGMRERATALGGELEAGPRPGGGFRVEARLPVTVPGDTGSAPDVAADRVASGGDGLRGTP